MDIRVIFILISEAVLALLLLHRAAPLKSLPVLAVSVALLILAFYIRLICLDYETLDYQNFLCLWVNFYRVHGGFKAMSYPLGNYNIPYLYFLALFSYSSIKDLYLIKLLSIFFDVLLAYAAAQLIAKLGASPACRRVCFFLCLFLPTVVLNGALWGQCDVIYVALAVLSIYQALDGRPSSSMMSMALSFGFKLQAVFVMPVLAVLWMKKKYSFKHFFIFPAAYVALVLPAVFLGRPFVETITLYFNQTGSIGSALNYNSPSVYSFFRYVPDEALASKIGILAAFAAMALVLLICLVFRRRLTDRSVVAAAMLFAVLIPFLLPHMHDRYFFAADILTLIMAFSFGYALPLPLLGQFASLLGYHAYLKMRYLLPMRYGAVSLILVIVIGFAALFDSFEKTSEKTKKSS